MKTTLFKNEKLPAGAQNERFAAAKFRWLLLALLFSMFMTSEASAQILLRGSASNSTTNTTLTINKPAGLAVGDLMIASMIQGDNDSDVMGNATLGGWTLVTGRALNNSGTDRFWATVLYKVADAADVAATSFAFALSSDGDDGAGGIVAFSGVDLAGGVSGGPFDVAPGTINVLSSDDLSATSITTATADAAVLMLGMVTDNRSMSAWTTTSPGALTELFDQTVNNDVQMQAGAAWGIKGTAGATGTGVAELSANENDIHGSILIALRRFNGTISTGAVSGPFCNASATPVTIPYTITGTYAAGNVFTAQLSNASGSFATPTNIGTVTATTAGNISASIPAGTPAGNGYRIRVVSSLPPATGANNGANLSVTAAATAVAGTNVTMCESSTSANITAGASATNNTGITWSTPNGTGSFSNANSLTLATYSPSPADIAAGSITITLTAAGNAPCGNTVSSKTLTILKTPTASAGGSQTICSNGTAVVSGASSSNGTIVWTEDGQGSITAGQGTLTPTYTAATADGGNAVTLTMTVSNSPCAQATAIYTVNVVGAPTVNAGSAFSTCSNSGSISIITGSSAANFSSVLWSSNGTGGFDDANSLTLAKYTPSAADITAGSVTLTLTAFGNGPCSSATSNKVLTILPIPDAAGAVICQGSPSTPMNVSSVCTNPPVTVAKFPTTGASVGSTGQAWTNPTRVVSDNNSNATSNFSSFGGASLTRGLNATSYGFAIPLNAEILGISVEIGRFTSSIGTGSVADQTVMLLQAGSPVGTNKAVAGAWPTSEAAAIYGGATDNWGAAWTAAQINATNFGVTLVANLTANVASVTANVDYIEVTVTYTVPGTIGWYTVSSGGTAIGTGASFNPVGVLNSGLANTNIPGITTYYVECSTVAGCRAPVDYIINPLPVVSFTGLDAVYCEDAAAATLTSNQTSGTFSGAGITNNGDGTASFNPVTAGVGPHAITFSYTDGNTCTNSVAINTNVNANVTYYRDFDNDGFGDIAVTSISCTGPPVGFVLNNTDCNDNDNTKNAEFQFYVDADGDTFGAGSLVSVCAVDANTPPANFSLNATDCDDTDVNKNATFPFFEDNDGDTFGAGDPVLVCAVDANTAPSTVYVLNDTDCDDTDNTKNAAFEFYADNDGDTYGAGSPVSLCAVNASTPPSAAFVTNSTDCDDTKSTVHPNATEIGYNLTDDDCDGLTDEGFPPKVTTMQSAQCNTTLAAIDTQLVANLVAGAQGYRWRITNLTGSNIGQVQTLDTQLRVMRLTQLASYAFATQYKVEVAVYYAGFLQPYGGTSCNVTTPATTTNLSDCTTVMTNLADPVYANIVAFCTGYRFRITDPVNALNTQEIDRALRDFRMGLVTNFVVQYGKTYNLEVAIRNTDGSYLPYGSVCTVTTPVFPTTSLLDAQCDDYPVPNNTTQLLAYSHPGALAYVFQLTGPGLAGPVEVTKNLRAFTLADFPGLVAGATYTVRVRIIFNASDPAGPFGKPCTIVTPGLSRHMADSKAAFGAIAYPNPFASSFNISVTTADASDLGLKVYDMTGRLLEAKTLKVQDSEALKIGDNYPSGVYNVVISQGENTKALRVIKR